MALLKIATLVMPYKFVHIAGISPKKAAIKNRVQALETFGGFRTGIVCAYQKLSSW
ncbi:hypothetical protein HN018_24915 (plasmid) [Lichenicola cladoniae]|uniref:Uncharacterized protein n=1 Tax=Lichenicola cladoniae TaxID=1484109 RepID=A0A6M8HYL0_9PROT|nr:hypothetical protein [Lichenicola cladoniae]NPD68208.1 hypothetical protein [Acetobacteraceae bacterium]QKE93428.1 hypothetical protein HN018_24915 [Lichenicola cladoniae]